VAAQSAADINFGTVGRPLAGTEVRISGTGELLVRGPGLFSGYNNDEETTDKVLIDGWFHTGEKAAVNEKGQLILLAKELK
jgi:long-chain acyl-CoA synthetase